MNDKLTANPARAAQEAQDAPSNLQDAPPAGAGQRPGLPGRPEASVSSEDLAAQTVPGSDLPLDVARLVAGIGRVHPAVTEAMTVAEHGAFMAEQVVITANTYGQDGPQPLYWLALEDGTERALAVTGTSPNSAETARALAGAWNHLVYLARNRLALDHVLEVQP